MSLKKETCIIELKRDKFKYIKNLKQPKKMILQKDPLVTTHILEDILQQCIQKTESKKQIPVRLHYAELTITHKYTPYDAIQILKSYYFKKDIEDHFYKYLSEYQHPTKE